MDISVFTAEMQDISYTVFVGLFEYFQMVAKLFHPWDVSPLGYRDTENCWLSNCLGIAVISTHIVV